jgi:phage terminase large subunit-like protein
MPIKSIPAGLKLRRRWDLTAGRGDYTACVPMGMSEDGRLYILDVRGAQLGPGANENMIRQTAALDGITVPVRIKQEPGSSGVALIDRYPARS